MSEDETEQEHVTEQEDEMEQEDETEHDERIDQFEAYIDRGENWVLGWFWLLRRAFNRVFHSGGILWMYLVCMAVWTIVWGELQILVPPGESDFYRICIVAFGSISTYLLFAFVRIKWMEPIFLGATVTSLARTMWKSYWHYKTMTPIERVIAITATMVVSIGLLYVMIRRASKRNRKKVTRKGEDAE